MNSCTQYLFRSTSNSITNKPQKSNKMPEMQQSNTYIPMMFDPNFNCDCDEGQMTEPLPNEREKDNKYFELSNNNVKAVESNCLTSNLFSSFNDSEKSDDNFYFFDDEFFNIDSNETIFPKFEILPNADVCFSNMAGQKYDCHTNLLPKNKPYSPKKIDLNNTDQMVNTSEKFILSNQIKVINEKPTKAKSFSFRSFAAALGYPTSFEEAMKNNKFKFNPFELGFEPQQYWVEASKDFTFNGVVSIFFRARLNINTKFMYKLYNMLILTTVFPEMRHIIGVYWVTDEVFAVEKEQIALMLNLSPNSVNGSLFNKQGNFQTHGFEEVCPTDISGDDDLVRETLKTNIEIYYYTHKDKVFRKGPMNSCDLYKIKYKNETKKIYHAKQKDLNLVNKSKVKKIRNVF